MWPALAGQLALLSLRMVMGLPRGRSLISVENQLKTEETEDPDSYLWEKLPGRCCFDSSSTTCDACSVWSSPDNFCHTSKDSCAACGATHLYCDPPPPLLTTNKVCVGESRLGTGCYDNLGTGMCKKSNELGDCELACARTAHCQMMVLYSDIMRAGSCVLCRDLFHSISTMEGEEMASSRVYAFDGTFTMGPPSPPHTVSKHFSILSAPSPPPAPLPPPMPPKPPPAPLPAHLTSFGSETHVECDLFDETDFSARVGASVDLSRSTDLPADSARHCCSLCGLEADCTEFVYEPASKTCVLLPHVPSTDLLKLPNPSTTAGTIRISRQSTHHARCHFQMGVGYAGGALGLARPLPDAPPVASQQACCDACERAASCAKFSFDKRSNECLLFESYAEVYYTFGLASGTVDSRFDWRESDETGDQAGSETSASSPLSVRLSSSSEMRASAPPAVWEMDNLPPASPLLSFAKMRQVSHPILPICHSSHMPFFPYATPDSSHPSPDPFRLSVFPSFRHASPPPPIDIGKRAIGDISLFVIVLIAAAIGLFIFLFFAADLQSLLSRLTGPSGGAYGKVRPTDPTLSPRGPSRSARSVKITVETRQMTQKKPVELKGGESRAELFEAIFDEFGHLLKGLKPKQTAAFCYSKKAGCWLQASLTHAQRTRIWQHSQRFPHVCHTPIIFL